MGVLNHDRHPNQIKAESFLLTFEIAESAILLCTMSSWLYLNFYRLSVAVNHDYQMEILVLSPPHSHYATRPTAKTDRCYLNWACRKPLQLEAGSPVPAV